MTRLAELDSTKAPDKQRELGALAIGSLDNFQLPARREQNTQIEQKQITDKGFPKIELVGLGTDLWAQPAHGSQTGLKGLFSGSDTLESHLLKHELKNLNPAQQADYNREERAMSAWNMQLGFGAQMPDTPVHKLVQNLVEADKKHIIDTVKSSMSQAERVRLNAALQENENRNPLGMFDPDPLSRPLRKQTRADEIISAYRKQVLDETERITQ